MCVCAGRNAWEKEKKTEEENNVEDEKKKTRKTVIEVGNHFVRAFT